MHFVHFPLRKIFLDTQHEYTNRPGVQIEGRGIQTRDPTPKLMQSLPLELETMSSFKMNTITWIQKRVDELDSLVTCHYLKIIKGHRVED